MNEPCACQRCFICGGELCGRNAVTLTGPDVNLVLGPAGVAQATPVSCVRICAIHLVPAWLYGTFSPRVRSIALGTALAMRGQVHW